jgi:hypothetical protein
MSREEERHYLEILGDELALAVGQAICAFTRIEWLIYEYLKQLSLDDLDLLMADQLFRTRTIVLRRLVERLGKAKDKKDQALAWITSAEQLSEKRNTIVHNPWQIWIDSKRRDFMTEIQRYAKRDKKLDLAQVRDFTERAQEIASGLKESLAALTTEP